MPLVHEAFDFNHGVFLGATAASEPTAAALDLGNVKLRFDPFAMTPFISVTTPATICSTGSTWARSWVIKHRAASMSTGSVRQRTANGCGPDSVTTHAFSSGCVTVSKAKVGARETPIGLMPVDGELTLDGLDIPEEDWAELMKVDTEAFTSTLADAKAYLAKFGDKLPPKIVEQLDKLEARLNA